ncbi:MAG: histidine phosphatase family protein [Brevibacillus sp.]|nr:histidine phosphatase family protein [Brevibacillus sp.]
MPKWKQGKPQTTFYLIRHGETDWNRQRRLQGQTDVPLNASGQRQARAVGETLSMCQVDVIYCSDLRRAKETADTIGRLSGGLECKVRQELRERLFGPWEGMTLEEIRLQHHDFERLEQLPGIEPWPDLKARAYRWLMQTASLHAGQTVAVVTHAAWMKALLDILLPDTTAVITIPNGSCCKLVNRDKQWLWSGFVFHPPSHIFQDV